MCLRVGTIKDISKTEIDQDTICITFVGNGHADRLRS